MANNRYTMLFEKPAQSQTAGLSRVEKYRVLKKHSKHVREHLEKWLKERNLSSIVTVVEPETAFNVLFIDSTRDVGKLLEDFPEKVAVGKEEPLKIDALGSV